MIVSLQVVNHCICDYCKAAWEVGDRKLPDQIECPNCREPNSVEGYIAKDGMPVTRLNHGFIPSRRKLAQ
ncbi:MAG TPA: hypothetical protein V6C65_04645 [Allocoleopsis sp.]